MSANDRDSSTWDAIAGRDFRDWHGLPRYAAYAEFEQRFPRLTDAEASGFLGSANIRARYRVHTAPGYPQHLRGWYVGPELVLVEATLPQLTHSATDLLTALGEPAAQLESRWGVLDVPGGLKVYPRRGIAVFVGPESQVLRLYLFTPGQLEDFLQRLHYKSRLEERPLREKDRECP